MSCNVVAMLTKDDKTVPGAKDIFLTNKGAGTKLWGFKDVNIELAQAAELVSLMKACGKVTFLEPLVEADEDCVKAAQFAVDCKFEYVVGMLYKPEVAEILKKHGIKYFPTCGRRSGIPRMLYGTIEEVLDDARRIVAAGVDGICLSAYRYVDGEPEDLIAAFVSSLDVPFMLTGGINSWRRLDVVKRLQPWGFTIGSALFDNSFGREITAAQRLDAVQAYLTS